MLNLYQLYDYATAEGIRIDNFELDRSTLSLAIYINGKYAIALDLTKLKTMAEITSALAHEIGHCETHSFYNVYSPFDVRSKHEARADEWAIKNLIPKDELIKEFKKGIVEIWELAERFNVTEQMMIKACRFYGFMN